MIGRLTGLIAEKSPPQVLVDVNGVGYELDVPMSTFFNLPALGERTTLLTHFIVREDDAGAHQRVHFLQMASILSWPSFAPSSGVILPRPTCCTTGPIAS